jgi:hypothetical protein
MASLFKQKITHTRGNKMKIFFIGTFIIFALVLLFICVQPLKNLSNPHLEGKSAPSPTITLNGHQMIHKYESLCWNKDCSQKEHNPPSVSINDVKTGDIIEIDWHKFRVKPNRVILHNLTTDETIAYHLKDTDIEMDVSKQIQKNPYLYEVIFQWYIGKSSELKGESFLTFKVKAN